MPTYQYVCTVCGHQLEAVQSFSDAPLTVCPECDGALRKVFSSVGVVFKGSGFYRTDSRAGSEAKAESASGSGESKNGKAPAGKTGGGAKEAGSSGGTSSATSSSGSSTGSSKASTPAAAAAP